MKRFNLKKGIIAILLTVFMVLPAFSYSFGESVDALKQKIKKLEQQIKDMESSNNTSDQAYESLKKQYEELLKEKQKSTYKPEGKITLETKPMMAGSTDKLNLNLKNTGNTALKKIELTIGTFPEGMTLTNASSVTTNIEQINYGMEANTSFDVKIDKNVKSGNYPIAFTIKARYGDDNQEYTSSQTFYMEIVNKEEKKEAPKVSVNAIAIPQSAGLNQDFNLSFQIANNGTSKIEGLKITAEPTGGIVNKTRNIFTEDVLEPGKPKSYSVTFYAPGGEGDAKVDSKNYPIKITVESTGAVPAADKTPAPESISISQYTGILIIGNKGGEGTDGVKAPQLMVENYSYGGSYVEAGRNFTLNLTMLNTSKEKRLRNIKVSLNSEEGTFIPFNTSNSFFIDSLAPGGRTSKSITFSTKPDAKAQTIALNLESTYEDMKGNALTAKDIISIPVAQVTKLDIDDAATPPEAYAGQPTNLTMSFYNTGKNVLRNLKISAQGNFDTQGSVSYFVGNMDPGKSDSYDLQLIPRATGPVNGTVTFTYEDIQGKEQTIEKTFEFTATEMPPMEDPNHMPQEPQKKNYTPYYIGGGVLAVAVMGFILWKKRRKRRKEQEMSIDE